MWKAAWLAFAALILAAPVAQAETYRVGPGEEYATISEVAERLEPGDVVEVTGDITDTVDLTKHGRHDAPITVRGVTRVENGRIIRPRMTRSRSNYIMACTGDWVVVSGLEFDGSPNEMITRITGLHHGSSNLVIRNCLFRNCARKAIQGSPVAGSITIEFCEFEGNGSGTKYHSVDLFSRVPGATVTIQWCYLHDGTGGVLLKSHALRNIIRYNWFESPYYSALSIVDLLADQIEMQQEHHSNLYPMHTDIVGNVFIQGWSPGGRYCLLRLGGEWEATPGTEGDFHIAHNLFVTTRSPRPGVPDDEGTHMRIQGNVDRLRLYNNVFLEYGVAGACVYSRGKTWDTPRTTAFRKRRGHGEPIIAGSNNWIATKAVGIPESFVNTLRGINPHFVDLVNFDFRPAKDSPLVRAGMHPLPQGRIVELAPEYEPQRGIPADLEPSPRRKVTPPAIGPFEAVE